MPQDRPHHAHREPGDSPSRRQTYSARQVVAALWPYLLAAALYIAIGVAQPRFLLSWSEGIIFLLLVVWGVPELYRRRRRR